MPEPNSNDRHAEETVPDPAGRVITALVMRLSMRRGRAVAPQMTQEGVVLPLAPRLLGGSGEVVVIGGDQGTRVVLRGTPPPWPLRIGWARKTLDKLLR